MTNDKNNFGMNKYVIETERLGLRVLNKEDIKYLEALDSDPEVRNFFPTGAQSREEIEIRIAEFILNKDERGLPCFVIFNLKSGEFMGRAGFGPVDFHDIEVGYVLHKQFWGQGYASEVLSTLLLWAKENIKADYITAHAPVKHLASQRVMQKCGMEHYKDAIKNCGQSTNGIIKEVECSFYRIKNN